MSRLLLPRDERDERRQLGLIVLGMLALFSPTLLSLPPVWLRSYHEHGFLVLGLVGLTLGAAYAHLFVQRWQAKLQIVALAALAAILGNWLRVALLVVLGDALGITSPWVGDHLWQGWSIFLIVMIPAYLAFRVVERHEAESVTRAMPGDDAAGSAAGWDPRRPRRAALAGMVAVIGPTIYLVVSALPTRQATPGVAYFAIAEGRAAIELAARKFSRLLRSSPERLLRSSSC